MNRKASEWNLSTGTYKQSILNVVDIYTYFFLRVIDSFKLRFVVFMPIFLVIK